MLQGYLNDFFNGRAVKKSLHYIEMFERNSGRLAAIRRSENLRVVFPDKDLDFRPIVLTTNDVIFPPRNNQAEAKP